MTKDKKYEFDLRWDNQGFFVSSKFLNLLFEFEIKNFHYTMLHIVNKNGSKVSSKEYYYLRFYEKLENAIDLEKSKIEYDRNGNMKKIWSLQLISYIQFPDLFLLNHSTFTSVLFVLRNLKKKLKI